MHVLSLMYVHNQVHSVSIVMRVTAVSDTIIDLMSWLRHVRRTVVRIRTIIWESNVVVELATYMRPTIMCKLIVVWDVIVVVEVLCIYVSKLCDASKSAMRSDWSEKLECMRNIKQR